MAQLQAAYARPVRLPTLAYELRQAFLECLALASAEAPLTIVLDAVEQLRLGWPLTLQYHYHYHYHYHGSCHWICLLQTANNA